MVVNKVVIKKIRSGTSYEVGKNGIQFISLKGDWIVCKGKGFTLSSNPIEGIEKIVVFDGAKIPEEFREVPKQKAKSAVQV